MFLKLLLFDKFKYYARLISETQLGHIETKQILVFIYDPVFFKFWQTLQFCIDELDTIEFKTWCNWYCATLKVKIYTFLHWSYLKWHLKAFCYNVKFAMSPAHSLHLLSQGDFLAIPKSSSLDLFCGHFKVEETFFYLFSGFFLLNFFFFLLPNPQSDILLYYYSFSTFQGLLTKTLSFPSCSVLFLFSAFFCCLLMKVHAAEKRGNALYITLF